MRNDTDRPDGSEGDPSAMGEAQTLPPIRNFQVGVFRRLRVKARTVQDAIDLARAEYGDAFTGQVEAE